MAWLHQHQPSLDRLVTVLSIEHIETGCDLYCGQGKAQAQKAGAFVMKRRRYAECPLP